MPENYLKNFSKLLERTEVPERFALWSGIASLLAALERRIYINQGIYTIYPNYYMILVAASGQKKSTAINTASKLLKRLNPMPNIVSQKITPEALITALRVAGNDEAKVFEVKCGGIIVADELTTFLDKNSLERGLGPMLTELYDCKDYEYQTKARGVEKLENGYLSLLGGTTVELIRNALPKDAIGGGFTSRTIFIYEDRTPAPVAWIDFDEELLHLEQALVDYLQRVMELKGVVTLAPDAKAFFIADYNARHTNGEFRKDPLLRSYENRRHAHLLKVAMAIMVSEEPQLVMQLHHLRTAKIILEEAEEYMPRVIQLIAASDIGSSGGEIMTWIDSQTTKVVDFVTRRDLVRAFAHKYSVKEIVEFVDTLAKGERIKIDTEGGQIVYRKIKPNKGYGK